MEVDPPPGRDLVPCRNGYIAGNGKGRLKVGGELESISGAKVKYYTSTTALMLAVNGQAKYLDSSTIPTIVIPKGGQFSLGQVVWVRAPESISNNEVFAVAGDIGPAFGEGSISLHQLLRYGQLKPQNVGPIPLEFRCKESEENLKAPFESRPDFGKQDKCNTGRTPKGTSDIRAYTGLPANVEFVMLGKARFAMDGNTIRSEVTVPSIQNVASGADYSVEKIREMASCIH
jgi:hypothetical protein